MVTVALGASLVAGEVVLRIAGYSQPSVTRYDPTLGFALRPNITFRYHDEGDALMHTNSAGFRDVDHTSRKPPNTVRVAVFGDSYAEARQVDIDSTFWKRLEGMAGCAPPGKRLEVLNFGVSGYGTAQELIAYRTIARRYDPDLVVLAFTQGNDVTNNSVALETFRNRPFFRARADSLTLDTSLIPRHHFGGRISWLYTNLVQHSRLTQLGLQAYSKRRNAAFARANAPPPGDSGALIDATIDPRLYSIPTDPQWQDAWLVTERLLKKFAREVNSAGARFAVVTLSTPMQVYPDTAIRGKFVRAHHLTDLFQPERTLGEIGSRTNIPVFFMAPALQAYADSTGQFLHGFKNTKWGIGHWNNTGHRIAAQTLARDLCPTLSR